jgi:glycosyltransferase involved in cell wall biosynthesis
MTSKTVSHVIVNNLGGITSLVQNLILFKGDSAVNQDLILIDIDGNLNSPAIINEKITANVSRFSLRPKDNWYHTYKRLANCLRKSEGLLVTNDQYDLIMLQAFNIPQKVVQLVHDEYNLQLSIKFSDCIDVFLAHSLFIYELLLKNLPERKKDIIHIPYGVPLGEKVDRRIKEGPLKLVFLGRHEKAKGVYDLHKIDHLLKEKGVSVNWLILGSGQETETLKKDWSTNTNVAFTTPEKFPELMQLVAQCDIFVFPTKFEGFPVSLLETMSAGCIPVATDLPGGIQEIVKEYGSEDAVTLAEAGKFDGDVNSFIFAEAIDNAARKEMEAKTEEEKIKYASEWADYAMRYDEAARKGGRFISAISDFYKKSPLGVLMVEKANRENSFKEWFKNKEKSYKEVFEELTKEPEFKDLMDEKVQATLKEERKKTRADKRQKIDDFFDRFL